MKNPTFEAFLWTWGKVHVTTILISLTSASAPQHQLMGEDQKHKQATPEYTGNYSLAGFHPIVIGLLLRSHEPEEMAPGSQT